VSRLISIVQRFWVDALLVLGIGVSLAIAAKGPDPEGAEGPIWVDVLITLAFYCPLFFRRRFPMAAPLVSIVAVGAASFADAGFLDNDFAAFVTALGISVWFGMRPDLRQAIGGLLVLQAVSAVITYNDPQTQSNGDYLWSVVTFTVAWIVGFAYSQNLRTTDVTRRLAE